ncbi:hypothetical protein [Desulfonema limicola]|nr:hypothetical protein [Desulfonema limicola]
MLSSIQISIPEELAERLKPIPEDIMKLHPSESFQARISSLLEKTGILVCLRRRKGNGRSISILNIWYAWQKQKPVSD